MPASLVDEQRRLLERLAQLVDERARAEASTRASFEAREATRQEKVTAERQRLATRHRTARERLQSEYTHALSQVARDFEGGVRLALKAQESTHRDATTAAEQEIEKHGREWESGREAREAEYEEGVRELTQMLLAFRDKTEHHRVELTALEQGAERVLARRYCRRKLISEAEPTGKCDLSNPFGSFSSSLEGARQALQNLSNQRWPAFQMTVIVLMIPVLVVTVGMLIALYLGVAGSGQLAESAGDVGRHLVLFAAGGVGILALMGLICFAVRPLIVRQTRQGFTEFRRHVADGHVALDAAMKLRAAEADGKKKVMKRQMTEQLRLLDRAHQQRMENVSGERERQLSEGAERVQAQRKTASDDRDARQAAINEQFSRQTRELNAEQDAQNAQLAEEEKRDATASREMFDRAWGKLVDRWKTGVGEIATAFEGMIADSRRRFPSWTDTDWERWAPPADCVPSIQFGTNSFRMDMIEHGAPEHEDLRLDHTDFTLPAVAPITERSAFLLEAWDEGRSVASRTMQNVMLRLLTGLPPGKVRFTIIDPVGLGQNFSAFMHLADFDEKLVNHRIWTEPAHIAQRLSDLTEHMEDVIQTYLRNEFRTIDEYNLQAGEVAEPYHVLVVANFPAGFSDEAAQRLLSIVASGARCGVYTLISTDSKLELPRNFDMADLETAATTLQWNGARFRWRDDFLKDLPLTLEEPPANDRLTQIIRSMGNKAKDAIRVEVPFTTVAARPGHWWTRDSRTGVEVALGRAGASKLQFLKLGHGTSQHVLIAGKTGSGKSTLLHALITNAALHYSPDELEFYLVDFKKGVEFKPYAARALPHARVVAIESAREFGLSVLERLDEELQQRGNRFRQAGVQDIKAFRDENPTVRMPRILLIVDEFQELFTQDDRLSQDAALLLDRLVRQGRAFGIHVLLGSQTLAGAYSLARSTLGQMAVRIALQCSEADSHLILSEDNTAARLLNRPGEAIYNDANGLFEGNHPFQVVWLGAGEQDEYLVQLAARAKEVRTELPPRIVFEGNVPADLAENEALRQLALGEPMSFDEPHLARAWLGSAVAIKEPTSVVFRRQNGANLLLAGQQEDAVLGMMAACVLGLSANSGNHSRPRFVVLDGTRSDAPEAGWWSRFAERAPWPVEVLTPSRAGVRICELATEVTRRIENGGEGDSPIFCLVHHLARFRDLRRSDDDFGFSSMASDQPMSASKSFATLLRDGPAVGVHSLVWCDSFNTVNRWFERSTLREFDQRVLMQLSANDSSNLMDSPAASRLGQNRALVYSEEQGKHEVFRPYGVPSPDWLLWFFEQFASRTADPTPG